MPVETLLPLAGAWLWDKYGKSVTDKTAGTLKGQWDKFKWKDAATAYRAKVKKLYGTMQIMGMAEPLPLDDIFTDAYMLDKPTAFGRFDIERLKAMYADPNAPPQHAERLNGLRLVVEKDRKLVKEGETVVTIEKDRNLFILGKPGAGKTTFLKYIAVKAAEQTIDKVPIFINLKHWADSSLELMPFIVERFDICDFPEAQPFVEELLKSGSAIVLFDGLDEVSQESGQRDKQTRAMNNFVEKYDSTQCLITCRIAASDYSYQPFTYVEIADFTEKQIEIFAANWFRDELGDKDEQTSKRFLREFARDDNKGLRDLARTPLLLTLLCLAYNETLTFPRRRVEIYEEALDALLKKWDSSRRIKRDEVYRKLSLGHKENLLAHVAAETFEKNEYFIPQAKLERLITDYVKNIPPHDTNEATDGEAILKAIEAQHGIFVERAREVYSFSHLTFQEYSTARYIVTNAERGAITSSIYQHCSDRRWREVFLLTASLLSDARQFIATFRNGLDELLRGDEKLKALLAWANEKSASIEASPWLGRASCLIIELYYRDSINELDIALELIKAFHLIHDLDRNLAILLVHALEPGYAPAFDKAFANTCEIAYDLGSERLAEELRALSLPTDKTTGAERHQFANKLRLIMIRHRDIGHEWNLTKAQESRLADYIHATRLLQDCLELATMPLEEKKTVLNSLYLPPPQESEADTRQLPPEPSELL